MAEEFTRNRLYEYQTSANLVLQADRESRRNYGESTGEAESLWGKLDTVRMGDLTAKNHGVANEEKRRKRDGKDPEKKKKQRRDNDAPTSKDWSKRQIEDKDIGESGRASYIPSSSETRRVFEEILNLVQGNFSGQLREVLCEATDELITSLKSPNLRDNDKYSIASTMIGPSLNSVSYSNLLNLISRLTDYREKEYGDDGNKVDDDIGVAVVLDDDDVSDDDDDNDTDDDDYYGQVNDEDDDSAGEDTKIDKQLGLLDNNNNEEEEFEVEVKASDIDAHWLQRTFSRYYSDPNITARLADEVMSLFSSSSSNDSDNNNIGRIEDGLVALLDYEKFDLIRLLLRNRYKIYGCIRLKQAQGDAAELDAIKQILSNTSQGLAVLKELDMGGVHRQETIQHKKKVVVASGVTFALPRLDEVEDAIISTSATFATSEQSSSMFARPDKTLDLTSISFAKGPRQLSTGETELPEAAWRAQKKGYEEIHIPASVRVMDDHLVRISELPLWMQPAFSSVGVVHLNPIQSRMRQAALNSSENLLLCAPTGAGKTNVAVMCMLNVISQYRNVDSSEIDLNAFKIVYIAPMKALVQECVLSFSIRLKSYGITVRELSGDQNLSRAQIEETQVIVTTPEKWDIVTRKSGDRSYTQLVRLIIIDEIHLLHDDRGPVLECLVARTIRQVESTQEMIRMVGLSATLPNFEDVGVFLRVDPSKGLFFFDNSFRPVPLQQQYIGITEKKALKRISLMNDLCYEKVMQQAGRNQVLVFVHARAETYRTGKMLYEKAKENDALTRFLSDMSASRSILTDELPNVKSRDLKELLQHGFGIHHAGLVRSDRTLVEDLFAAKHIQVLISTATLAWGVNLPAHTVIIKGTQVYSPEKGGWVELSPLDVMQMMGRAGRYMLDSEGEGIIITSHTELQYYLSLMNQQLSIESQLIKKLPDVMNSEIVLGNIQTVKEAATWLGYTYLNVRMIRNPQLYGISEDDLDNDHKLYQRRRDLAHSAALILDRDGLIRYDRASGVFQVTALGRVASYYYIPHDSIAIFCEQMKLYMTDIDIMRLFTLSDEFKYLRTRGEEKLELEKLVERVPIPIKEGVDEHTAKVNLLLQAYISRQPLDGFSLAADMAYVQQSAARIMRALFEIALRRGWGDVAYRFLMVSIMTERRIWKSQSPLRQFSNIPDVILKKLEKYHDISWPSYYSLRPTDLGDMVKFPKMGKTLHKYVHMIPKLNVSAYFLPITRSIVKIEVKITPDFSYDEKVHESNVIFWVFVLDADGDKLLHFESFSVSASYSTIDHFLTISVPFLDPLPHQYFLKVVADKWLHSEITIPISFQNMILPQKFFPYTELLDLRPLPITDLVQSVGLKPVSVLFSGTSHFDAIHTQTFPSLFDSDENVTVCASIANHGISCAEFALLRLITSSTQKSNIRAVCIASKTEVAEKMFSCWKDRFGAAFDLRVVLLAGTDVNTDVKLFDNSNIAIATCKTWDTISRRWKQKMFKNVQNVSLFIMIDLQLIGGVDGPSLEITMSRMRMIASIMNKKIRFVGLGSPIANSKDLGEWIGASPRFMFSFAPSIRADQLDIHLHGFDSTNYNSRLLAMSKPVINALMVYGCQSGSSMVRKTIVFSPTRRQCQLTAIDCTTYAISCSNEEIFGVQDDESRALISQVSDESLQQTLSRGVGFIYEGMSSADCDIVNKLYLRGNAKLLIVPFSYCWHLRVVSQVVILMGTEYYDGQKHRFEDYAATDIVQMTSVARNDSQSGHAPCHCIVMCYSPKKENLRKILCDALPVESHIDQVLHNNINAEIVAGNIKSKQDAVDFMTWTFYYRRIRQNPNYYRLNGFSPNHISSHLSELIERVVDNLAESKCIEIGDNMALEPLNHGIIASYYNIQYTTIEMFAASVNENTRIKGSLDILSASTEFSDLPVRLNDDVLLKRLAAHLPLSIAENSSFLDASTKAQVLLQCHFSRINLSAEQDSDLKAILDKCLSLVHALVDVVCSSSWLKPAIAVMELSQMIVQGLWERDSPLLQIPHFSDEMVRQCASVRLENGQAVQSVLDILDMDEDDRNNILRALNRQQVADIALFCNQYPSIEVKYSLDNDVAVVGGDVTVSVSISREVDEGDLNTPIYVQSTRFPIENKKESWWVVVGDPETNLLMAIKKVVLALKAGDLNLSANVQLTFETPKEVGAYNLKLYVICDSYLGCDQEFEANLTIVAGN